MLLCDDKYEVLKEVLPTTPEDKNAKKDAAEEPAVVAEEPAVVAEEPAVVAEE